MKYYPLHHMLAIEKQRTGVGNLLVSASKSKVIILLHKIKKFVNVLDRTELFIKTGFHSKSEHEPIH